MFLQAIAILYTRWNLLKVEHSPAGLSDDLEERMTPNVHKDIDHIERTLVKTGGYLINDKMTAADIMACYTCFSPRVRSKTYSRSLIV